tara:strand:+ start:2039 stop:3298 length:1260 start_codon:yes stop_codon:yes gene_type:complete
MISIKGSKIRKPLEVNGALWVSDFKRNAVYVFDDTMTLRTRIVHPTLRKPRGMCMFEESVLVCCFDGDGWISKVNSHGCTKWKTCRRPRGIVYDGTFVYVTEVRKGVVLKVFKNATTICEFGKGKLNMPRGIDVTGNSLVIADSGNDRVVGISKDTGNILWSVPSQAPNDVIFNGTDCYVSQWYLKRVKRLRDGYEWAPANSGFLTMIGTFGDTLVVGDDSGAIHFLDGNMHPPSFRPGGDELGVHVTRQATLDLSGKELDDLSFSRFLPHIHNNPDVTRIELWQNELGDLAITELVNVMQNNLRLVNTLWLGHNKIGDDGIAAIGRALESHSSLTDVFVDNNLITSKGVESLCSNLVRAPQIRRLGLHTNRITDSAMLSLVRLLSTPVFSKLEFVFLKNNPISRGTQSIIERESFVVV